MGVAIDSCPHDDKQIIFGKSMKNREKKTGFCCCYCIVDIEYKKFFSKLKILENGLLCRWYLD